MESSFGARLRLRREQQQVSLAAIAEQTKIKLSLLEGLERDDVSQWPRGIFRRSYVRAYAQAIGLPPDGVLREFLERYPEPVADVEATLAEPSTRRRPQTRLGFLIGSAIGSLPALRRGGAEAEGHSSRVGTGAVATDGRIVDGAIGSTRPASDGVDGVDGDGVDGVDRAEAMATAVPVATAGGSPSAPPAEAQPPLDEVRRPALQISAVADLCTRLGQAIDTGDVLPVLIDAAAMLDAVGAGLWAWDSRSGALAPVLAHGYSDEVVARLPRIRRDADNAIAAAFRSAETCVVEGCDAATGALVVPLLTAGGCGGVLAVELRDGGERDPTVRAVVLILAAQLSLLVGAPPLSHAVSA